MMAITIIYGIKALLWSHIEECLLDVLVRFKIRYYMTWLPAYLLICGIT